MPKSIEHSPKFHMVRRIAKLIAPDFRILARSEFGREESCIDLTAKTIEVSELATEMDMVGCVLFHLGHLRLKDKAEFADHFGDFADHNEKKLIDRLSKQGAAADTLAAEWAHDVFLNNFNVSPERATKIIASHTWNESEWFEYYSQDDSKKF